MTIKKKNPQTKPYILQWQDSSPRQSPCPCAPVSTHRNAAINAWRHRWSIQSTSPTDGQVLRSYARLKPDPVSHMRSKQAQDMLLFRKSSSVEDLIRALTHQETNKNPKDPISQLLKQHW